MRAASKPSEKKEKIPKKRGRKSKEEHESWLAEQAEVDVNFTTYEKKLEAQLTISTLTFWCHIPIKPKWGVKKNSDGNNKLWFGFKGHLSVSTKSQYIVARLMLSGNLSDSKAAIPLVKEVAEVVPNQFTTTIFDTGYDYKVIYQQILNQDMKAVIPYAKRRKSEILGFDKNFRPSVYHVRILCVKNFLKSSVKQILASIRI